MTKENNNREAARHKQYYDQKFKCMKLVPGDLLLVRVKAFGSNHKIADRWEQVPYRVLSQHNDLQCTRFRRQMKKRGKAYILYTETCCFHYNQSGKRKFKPK